MSKNKAIQSVCIYCGSSLGRNPAFKRAAEELGKTLASRNITVVYGGGSVGLMGAVADAAMSASGKVIGVIPHALNEKEVGHNGLTELHIVNTMHERKAMMMELADAFIALPGGFGTFEEIFESITWAQLGIHTDPVGFLNIDGYYTPLVNLLDQATENGLIKPEFREMVFVEQDQDLLLDGMSNYVAPDVDAVLWKSQI